MYTYVRTRVSTPGEDMGGEQLTTPAVRPCWLPLHPVGAG